MSKAPQRREKQQWAVEQPRLDNAGNLGGIYFIGPDDLEFTETMINAREKLESPMESAVPCSAGTPVAKNPTFADQDMHASSELMNLRGSAWKELRQKIMKIALPGRDSIRWVITTLRATLSQCPSDENPGCESRRWQRMEELDTIAAWQLDKVKSKKEVIKMAERRGYSALCCANGHLPSQNSELEPKFQTYKGRVVLRGDIVKKNDSGSYAVFTEQGSSALQMTAAKLMDVRARLPGCAGQAAHVVWAYTQVIWRMLPNCWNFPSQNVQIFGHVHHGMSGKNHGPTLKHRLFLWSEICMVTHLPMYCGKDKMKKFYLD